MKGSLTDPTIVTIAGFLPISNLLTICKSHTPSTSCGPQCSHGLLDIGAVTRDPVNSCQSFECNHCNDNDALDPGVSNPSNNSRPFSAFPAGKMTNYGGVWLRWKDARYHQELTANSDRILFAGHMHTSSSLRTSKPTIPLRRPRLDNKLNKDLGLCEIQ